ncbi:TBCK protein kinase [Allomyces macrogynus ATCC 38327]|uniref:TBCK protein kinase n=1 Tax=Allomyces macrogynus (strain ATCC 38327) TaxID=578462 RepID=A0A0L0SL30_ALLM3|nr:TBCK protein kinase [Allomyces macrogynus ATCC 38327]|eukprot:KNE63089.1 TBCK protein kinase [Allomyces macrogynus ATCC 38327]
MDHASPAPDGHGEPVAASARTSLVGNDLTGDRSLFAFLRNPCSDGGALAVLPVDLELGRARSLALATDSLENGVLVADTDTDASSVDPDYGDSDSEFNDDDEKGDAASTNGDDHGAEMTVSDVITRVAGRFSLLQRLSRESPYLCTYIECMRGGYNDAKRLYLLQEAFPQTLQTVIASRAGEGEDSTKAPESLKRQRCSTAQIRSWARHIVEALALCQRHGIQHRYLVPENVHLNDRGDAMLSNFALYHLSDEGKDFIPTLPPAAICPPEAVLASAPLFSSFKADVWALGLLLFHVATGAPLLPEQPKDYFLALASFIHSPDLLQQILASGANDQIDIELMSFLEVCLQVESESRPTPLELLQHPYLADLPSLRLRRGSGSTQHLTNLSVLFHLWLLDSGNLDVEYARLTHHAIRPPVLVLPGTLSSRNSAIGRPPHIHLPFILDLSRVQDQLRASLADPAVLDAELAKTATQPVSVREKNVVYQFHCIQRFSDLLLQYPLTTDEIVRESRIDIPPYLRASVWAALLGIAGDPEWLWARQTALSDAWVRLDDEAHAVQDRQLDADIHRCHAYHPVIASPTGQQHLKQLIAAWLAAHPDRVYWQGFDSVCGVFLSQWPADLGMAYACLDAFVARYLSRLLAADNAAALGEFFALLTLTLRFMDPELAVHLGTIGVTFDLFAMSWVLTLFAHILALPATYRLWDQLLARSHDQPAFRFILMASVLRTPTIRAALLASTSFDAALLLLSDFPPMDVQTVLQLAAAHADTLPLSIAKSFDFDSHVVPRQLHISLDDCIQWASDIRMVDLRFGNNGRPGEHFPRSTMISAADFDAIGPLLRQQRGNRRITVVRTAYAEIADRVLGKLAEWWVPGACWLEDSAPVPPPVVPATPASPRAARQPPPADLVAWDRGVCACAPMQVVVGSALLLPSISFCIGDGIGCEYEAARDSHALGVRRALAAGYLPGANVSIVQLSTSTNNWGSGASAFSALEAIKTGVVGILGGGNSDSAMQISLVTSAFRLPICSFIAGSALLSDKILYPWFYRFVVSAQAISSSVIDLMQAMKWTRFSLMSESGNSFVTSTRALVRSKAIAAGMSLLWDIDFVDVSREQDRMLAGLDQLIETDTQVLVLLHYTWNGAMTIKFLEEHGWFRTGQRVVLYFNSLIEVLQEFAPDVLKRVVDQATLLAIEAMTFDTTLFQDFKAEYQQRQGVPYPYSTAQNFVEGYACAYSMVAGLHRLVHESPHATLADLAARSPALYQNMNLSYFSIDHPLASSDFPLTIDKSGDVTPAYTWLGATRANLSVPSNSTSRYYKSDIVGLPVRDGHSSPIHLGDFVFPGLAPGQIPSDRGPQTLNNISATSPGGIAALTFTAIVATTVLVCVAYLHGTSRGRTDPHVRCASHVSLGTTALACLALLLAGLANIDIPIAPWACVANDTLIALGSVAFLVPEIPRLWYLWRQQELRRQLLRMRRTSHVPGSEDVRSRPSASSPAGSFIARGIARRRFRTTSGAATSSKPGSDGALPVVSRRHSTARSATRGLPWKKSRRELETEERVIAQALSGQSPWPLVRSSLWFCGGTVVITASLATWNAVVNSYTVAATYPSRGNVLYICMPADPKQSGRFWNVFMGWSAFLVILTMLYACRCWRNPFNSSEAKRTVFLVFNFTLVHILLYSFATTGLLTSRFPLFSVALLLYFGSSSWLAIVAPVLMHIRKSRNATGLAIFNTVPKPDSTPDFGDEQVVSHTARLDPSLLPRPGASNERCTATAGPSTPNQDPDAAVGPAAGSPYTALLADRDDGVGYGHDRIAGETGYRTVVFDVHVRQAVPRHMRSEVSQNGRFDGIVDWWLSWSLVRGFLGSTSMDWAAHELWCLVPNEASDVKPMDGDGGLARVQEPGYLHVCSSGPKEDSMNGNLCAMSMFRAHLIPPTPPAASHSNARALHDTVAARVDADGNEDFGLMQLDHTHPTAASSSSTRMLVLRVATTELTRAFTVRFASTEHGARFLALLQAHSSPPTMAQHTPLHDDGPSSALTMGRGDTRGRARGALADAIMSRIAD